MAEGGSVIDALWVSLGFQVHREGIDEFEHKTHDLRGAILGVGAALGISALGIKAFLERTVGAMAGVQHFGEVHGIAAREVQALGKVAAENHSSLEAMEGTLAHLSRTTGQAALGIGRGAALFQKLGLDAHNADGSVKGVKQVMGEVADMLKGKSFVEQQGMAGRLGIDENLIPLLAEGRTEWEKMVAVAERANPITAKNYADAEKAEKTYTKLKLSLGVLGKQIAVELLPQINKLGTEFLAWWKDHGPKILVWLKDTTGKLADFITKIRDSKEAMTGLKVVASALILVKVGEWVDRIAASVGVLFKAISGGNWGTKIWLGLLGLIAAAIVLVIQDLYAYEHHMDSLTGRLEKKFPYAVQVMEAALGLLGIAFVAVGVKASAAFAKLAVAGVQAIWKLGAALLASPMALTLIATAIAAVALWQALKAIKELMDNWGAVKGWAESLLGTNKNDAGFALAADYLKGRGGTVAGGMVTYKAPSHIPATLGGGASVGTVVNVGKVENHIHTNSEAAAKRGINQSVLRNGQNRAP
jgi:hypothetical protein